MNTSKPDEPRAVRINAGPGHATITLDGADLSGVYAYSLQHDIREALPLLVLHTTTPGGAAWEGMARVAVADPQPPREAIAGFLSGIDPAALEAAALERDDLDGSGHELTRAMLAQLADWATGRR